ncbi:glycosyltransferase family 2 protein, partial [Escherichia coli]|nr:glycosyltransferase family 2 protein [Escherichia coli]
AILSLLLNNNKKLTLKMIFRGIIDGVKGITGRVEIK